jgi:serine/threonine protein phosphatase PrpC
MGVIPNRTLYSETIKVNDTLLYINGKSIIGGRDYMEDTFMSEVYDDVFLCGIFDGHGGSFTSINLPCIITSKMTPQICHFLNNAEKPEIIHFFKTFFSGIDHDLKYAINDVSGSTAILCVITKRFIILVNCGDSRGVLYTNHGVILIETVDHTPAVPSEKARIKKLGGTIQNSYIEGILSVSRSFGDYELKKPGKEFISVKPDVYITELKPSTVILGSDGIWDRITPSATSIKSALQERRDILNLMIGNHTTGDNKTILVVEILRT